MQYLKRGYPRTPRLEESMRRGPRKLFVKPNFSHLAYSDRLYRSLVQGGLTSTGIPTALF
jgi:protein-L-isoaspartate O-methyltransferase